MLRIKLIKNKSFKEFLMPSYIEYWRTLSYSTCQQYKSYKNIVRFRKNLSKHATKNGVTLINSPGDNDYQNFINNIIKPKARRAAEDNGIACRAKRVRLLKIEIAQAPMVIDDALRPTRANASASASVAQQPIAQALALVQEADSAPVPMVQLEQPMADAAPVPMIQFGQPMAQEQVLLLTGRVELGNEMNVQQPMVDTTPVPMIQPEQPMAQAQVPMQEAAISLPHCTNTPIFNGANKPLVLNGLVIEVDPVTLMVNATQMCKAAGKFFAEYHRSKCYKDFQNELSEAMGIPIGELTICENGNRKGTMVHRRIALHLAHRISPVFEVQVTGYLDELFMTGRVELGNEMNVQQLNEKFEQRVKEASKEVQAKASADVKTEQDRCQELELQLATIQEAQQLTKAAQEELMAIKAREDLETTIQALVNNTAPTIASFKNGDNVLYLARIDETKFKYGHTKNIVQRFDAHMRPGVYPMFEPVGIFLCNNGVAAEDKVHAYVKKNKLKAEYGTQREIILLDNVDKLQRLIKMMQKCTTFMALTQSANDNTDVELRRIELEMKRIELLMECKITFEQYLQMK